MPSATITSLTLLVKAARDAYTAQQNAKQAGKAATTALHNALTAMRNAGGDVIKTIKAYAATTNNPNVYNISQVDPPAPPTPLPAPGQPSNFKVEVTPSGAIQLTWKAKDATVSSGVFFSVRRKLGTESAFALVGNVGAKKFLDSTILQGTISATYIVQGFRGEVPGDESDQLTVQFGVSAGGGNVQQLKMAA